MKRSKLLCVLLILVMLISIGLAGCANETKSQSSAQPAPQSSAQPAPQSSVAPQSSAPAQSSAQPSVSYPKNPINMEVGFSPGGPTDVIARGITPILQEKLGVGIGITNNAGAASATAANKVLSQPKDGYTLFFGSESMSLWQVTGVMDMSPTRDFIPVKLVSQAYPVIAVPPNSKFSKAEEFIQYAIDHPGELRIGTAGPATVPHMTGLLLQRELGCKFTFVPFQGGGPAVTAVMGGQVDATIEMVQGMVEANKAGKLKILASFTNKPIEGLGIKPIGELYPKLQPYLPYEPYFGLFVAKGTPPEIIKILEAKMEESVKDPRWTEYCKKLFLPQINISGDAAVKFVDEWTSMSAWLLYESGGAKESPEKFGIKKPAAK